MFGLVLFVPPAGAQSGDITVGWGTWFGDTPTSLNGPNGPSDVVQMVTTNSDTYVLDSQGTVWAAGDNMHGELGVSCASPCNPTTTLKKVKALPPIESLALVGPEATMMAIARGSNGEPGDVYGWGNNQYGELCNSQQNIDPPIDLTQAHDVMPGVTLMAGAGDHATYYVASNNTLYSCGRNMAGDLGDDTTNPSKTPMAVKGISDSSPVVSITASWADEGVLLSDGTFWTWGFNGWGQLGYSTGASTCTVSGKGGTEVAACGLEAQPVTFSSAPPGTTAMVPVNPLNNTVTMGGGSPDDGQTMAILSNGAYYAWGDDSSGQLCNGSVGPDVNDTPTAIDLSSSSEVAQPLTEVASGGTTGYLLDSDHDVFSCGDNTNGQIGNGKHRGDHPVLDEVIDDGRRAVSAQHQLQRVFR